jgi:hypothetical protein
MVRAVAHLRSVKSHVRAHRRLARLRVEERRQPIRRLPSVATAPAVGGDHRALHDLSVDAEQRLPHTRSRVRRVKRQVALPLNRRRARQLAARVARVRASILFERQVGSEDVDGGGIAVCIAFSRRAFEAGFADARRIEKEM